MILAHRFHYPAEYHDNSLQALETALASVPAYGPWNAFDPGPDAPLDARYDAMPELTKAMMRENFPKGLVPGGRDVEAALEAGTVEFTYTSGTTAERVINIWDQRWWDGAEAASWQLSGHLARLQYPPEREAKLSSALNFGISCEEDLPMEYRTMGRRLYLSEKINLIQWQRRHFARMARELALWQPVVLEANPSLLARLAYWALDEGVALYSPAAIVFTYEFTSKIHVAAIRKVFSSPLVSSYGTTETGFVLEECEEGYLHQNTDFCRIDFQPLQDRYGGPELGKMLVTTFRNPWNSIVRFDTGDLVRLAPSGTCTCGRSTGLIAEAVEGRVTNATFASDGSLVTTMAVDTALSGIPEIRDYHLEQHSGTKYELQLMLKGSVPQTLDRARAVLEALYGRNGEFEIKVMDNIYPGPAGKFRRTQANFDYDLKGLFV